jgi:uncharacterized small protein (DUF1192 family)
MLKGETEMNQLTISEHKKVHEITERLGCLSSPVLRLQAILQFSQIVDMLSLGDTSRERTSELISDIDRLENELEELKNGAQAG